MNPLAEFYRVVVLRKSGLADREVTILGNPVAIHVPLLWGYDKRGRPEFGAITYAWDGRETTVAGYPVFR